MNKEKIQILPKLVSNQIAAGEVVERPASVVKELVENSLDAGSQKIEVVIKEGGLVSILVRDDGNGIEKDQLELAVHPHATSKLTSLADLESLDSLGFRGEALASIASVSRFKLQSKVSGASAWEVSVEGSNSDMKSLPTAHPDGTSVWVEQLFFNTPVRRKFLRAATTEFHHIDSLIKRLALSRPDVRFLLKHNEKVVRDYRSVGNVPEKTQLRRISDVMSKNFANKAHYIERDAVGLSLRAWVGSRELASTSSDKQCFFLNGRWVRDKLLSHAVKVALQPHLDEGLYPAYVIFLQCDPATVDVNVHPTKHEVRFREPRLIHDFIQQSLQNLLGAEPTEEVAPEQTNFFYNSQTSEPSPQSVQESSRLYYHQMAVMPNTNRASSGMVTTDVQPEQMASMQVSGFGVQLKKDMLQVIDLKRLVQCWLSVSIANLHEGEALESVPLLMPVRIQHKAAIQLENYVGFLKQLGIVCTLEENETIFVKKIPAKLPVLDVSPFFDALVSALLTQSERLDFEAFTALSVPLLCEHLDVRHCDDAQWQAWFADLPGEDKHRVTRQFSPESLFNEASESA